MKMFICAHQIEICVRDRVGQFFLYFSLGSANCDFSNSHSLGEGKKIWNSSEQDDFGQHLHLT